MISTNKYIGIANINSVIGSPVGVITADNISIKINNSGLLSVKLFTLMIFLLRRKRMIRGNWKEIPKSNEILIMN
tara:strand:- start:60 stop:284 length:225 start_codon:yes stop_codon:yes gene_type:complete